MLRETEKINVLNYNENRVAVATSPIENYMFQPAQVNGTQPTVIPMTIDQIRYVNNSNAFRSGLLFFDKNKEADVYDLLGIMNWESILRNSDIDEIILHPTLEGLNKIVAITDVSVFNRVRAEFFKLRQDGKDISVRVEQVINLRFNELRKKVMKSEIVITKNELPVPSVEIDELKSQNESLQAQLAEMQEMMKQFMASQSKQATTEVKSEPATTPKRSAGRPKKTTA